jgi:hypothetical protein
MLGLHKDVVMLPDKPPIDDLTTYFRYDIPDILETILSPCAVHGFIGDYYGGIWWKTQFLLDKPNRVALSIRREYTNHLFRIIWPSDFESLYCSSVRVR